MLLKLASKILGILILVVFLASVYIYLRPRPIPAGAMSIAFPLKNPPYFVTQNGPDTGVHQAPQEKFALDIVKGVPFFGPLFKKNLSDYPIYSDPIFSPCVGIIRSLRDDQPDNLPGVRAKTPNMIVVGCDGFDVYMAHLKKGSVKVHVGQIVGKTDVLAEVGNSGNSSEPHLHISIYKKDREGNVIPFPILFDGKYYLKWDTIGL